MCINVKVFDAIAAHGRGCSIEAVIEALPDIERESVASAVYRLKDRGTLKSYREIGGRGVHDRAWRNAAD